MTGHFIHGVEGIGYTNMLTGEYRRLRLLGVLPWGSRALRDFRLLDDSPLTWLCDDGTAWQPCRRLDDCDGMSVPRIVQALPDYQHDRWLWPLLHDSAYRNVSGYGHGLWFRQRPGAAWRFQMLTRPEADELTICYMGRSEGMRPSQVATVYRSVRAFGPRW